MKYRYLLVLILIISLGTSYYLGYTPTALGVFFLLASVIAYFLYAKDKAAAKAGHWRVSENTLHLVALLCGWPGALVAQERLRHKTKKRSFLTVFWITVLVNLGGNAWLHSPQGNIRFRDGIYHLENYVISNVPYATAVSGVLFLTTFRKAE